MPASRRATTSTPCAARWSRPARSTDGVEQFEPAKDSFDTAELIDQKLADAEKTAAEHGCNVVVSMEDGKGVPVTTDFDPARIYVYTENDVVTEIEGVGGGI